MPIKRFFLISTIGLIALLWLTLLYPIPVTNALQTATRTPTPTRTPGPTPTPRAQVLRNSVLSNSVRGLGLNAPYDANMPPCQNADFGVSIWHNLEPVGTTAEIDALSREDGVMLRITDSFFPAICASDPIASASATNLSTNETIPALIWDYDPSLVVGDFFLDRSSVARFYVAQLPIEAYAQPGDWQLRISSPQTIEVTITIAAPQTPSAILDASGGYLILGFQPDEHVVGLIFNDKSDDGVNIITEIKDDFEIIADRQGTGRYISSTPYWDVILPHLTVGLMLFVGDQGSAMFYPQGEFGTSIFNISSSSSPADLNRDESITVDELIEYVRRNYWQVPSAEADCSGALPARLVVGQRARVTPGDSNNVRASASRDSVRVGVLPAGAEFDILSGPVCNGGYLWWQINADGLTGWTAESSSENYWLEPIEGSIITTPDSSTVTFSRNLFVTTPFMSGEDVQSVQSRLIDLGYDPGPIDGIYGPVTEEAVRQYQRNNGLVVDGIVGPITWASLFP